VLLHSLGTQNRRDSTPLVNHFQHPEPITTLVGSPQSRNLFQISGLATGRKAPYGITDTGKAAADNAAGNALEYIRPENWTRSSGPTQNQPNAAAPDLPATRLRHEVPGNPGKPGKRTLATI